MSEQETDPAVAAKSKSRAARRRFWAIVVRLVERFHHSRALTIVPENQGGKAGARVALAPHPDVPDREGCGAAWLSFDEDTGVICASSEGDVDPYPDADMPGWEESVVGEAIDAWPIDREFLATWQDASRDRALYLHAVRQLASLASVSDALVTTVGIRAPATVSGLRPLREGPIARWGWSVGHVVITDTAVARIKGAGEVDIVGRWLEGDDEATITRRIRKFDQQAEAAGMRESIEPVARLPEYARDIVPDPMDEGVFWYFNFYENGWFRWRAGERGDGTPVPTLLGPCGAWARIEGRWWLITSGATMLRLPWEGHESALRCMKFRSEKRLVIDPDGAFAVDDAGVRLSMPATVEQWAYDVPVTLPIGLCPGQYDWPLACGGGRWFAVVDPGTTATLMRRGGPAPMHYNLPTCGHPEHSAGHPTRPWFAFASRAVVVIDAALQRVVVAFDGRMEFRSVVFSPDGRWLLFATADGIALWKVGTGVARFIGCFWPRSNDQRAARFTASGNRVIFGGAVFDWPGLMDRWDTGTALMPMLVPPTLEVKEHQAG